MVLWIAFDMDSTLGYFESVSNYLYCFAPWVMNEIYTKPHYNGVDIPIVDLPDELNPVLKAAFFEFVRLIAEKEANTRLLRPGILAVISHLLEAKRKGLVGGLMIYSNNASKLTILFCQELIKHLLGEKEDIFVPTLCWLSPIRKRELDGRSMCEGPKTVNTIKQSFKTVYPNAVIKNNGVIFFDDLIHQDIKNNIPKDNYFHVKPYIRFCDTKVVHSAFMQSCISQSLPGNKVYIKTLKQIGFDFDTEDIGFSSMKSVQPTGVNRITYDSEIILRRLKKLVNVDLL